MSRLSRLIPALILLVPAAVFADQSADERAARQAELDAACEAARQEKIAVERAKYIEECVETGQRADRAACERYYADYGGNMAGRPPLHYDLPACEAAHEYRRRYRSSDN